MIDVYDPVTGRRLIGPTAPALRVLAAIRAAGLRALPDECPYYYPRALVIPPRQGDGIVVDWRERWAAITAEGERATVAPGRRWPERLAAEAVRLAHESADAFARRRAAQMGCSLAEAEAYLARIREGTAQRMRARAEETP